MNIRAIEYNRDKTKLGTQIPSNKDEIICTVRIVIVL